MVILSKVFLYPVFAFLIGALLLKMIPKNRRPTVAIPRNAFLVAVVSIIVLTFVPIVSVAGKISTSFNQSFFQSLQQVLFTFNIGQVWLVTFFISIVLMIVLVVIDKRPQLFTVISFLLVVSLIMVISKASHAASLEPTVGFFAQTIHFFSVSVWVGIIFVIGIWAKDERNWLAFLNWYTPVAVTCVSMLAVSGLFLMKAIVPDYTNALMLSYGQLLLVKHLLFLLIILYGIFNGYIIRKKLRQNPLFQPKKWLRVESIFLLFVLIVTAIMTEQSPPHIVSTTLEHVEPSRLFEWFHGNVGSYSNVIITGSQFGVFIAVFVLMIGFVIFFGARQNINRLVTVITSLVFVFGGYLLIMTSVTVENTFTSEGEVYTFIEEAIIVGHQDKDELAILQKGEIDETLTYVLYSINESQLISELLFKTEQGYQRIYESRLTISGTPLNDAKHKIRTFLITDGPWLQTGKTYTYVTFGFIQQPEAVSSVEIRYQGEVKRVEVENKSFFNVSASIEQWEALHPIGFYNQYGEEIGGYMRDIMETDTFCH